MEHLTSSIPQLDDRDLGPQRSQVGTIPCLPDQMEAQAIGSILDRWYFASGWKPLEGDDHTLMIAAWFEVLDSSSVPIEAYDRCYSAALARRAKRKSLGETVMNLSAEDLAVEWPGIRDKVNASSQRLLCANNAGTCQRCFGTGREEMIDGSVRDGCEHAPLSEEEKETRRLAFAQRMASLRSEMRKVKSMPVAKPPAEKRQPMECTSCARRVDGREGWQIGETCGALVQNVKCLGVMRMWVKPAKDQD